jgi:hypothetical protein
VTAVGHRSDPDYSNLCSPGIFAGQAGLHPEMPNLMIGHLVLQYDGTQRDEIMPVTKVPSL